MHKKLILIALILGISIVPFSQSGFAASTIKFAHNMPQKMDATYHRYFVKFEELAKKYTKGGVEFREFPASICSLYRS